MRKLLFAGALAGLLAACDSGPEMEPNGPAGPVPSAVGEALSFACQACHSLTDGGPHLIGPNLYGVFGRRAGSRQDFDQYSEALVNADFIWTPELLDDWLEDPAGFLPGTTMAFTGYRQATDRAALIEYLISATGGISAEVGD